MKMIQVLGTSSSAGKTTMAMVLCRYFSDLGLRVTPFKSVNMSLNSISLDDGSEISRSVWLQCRAARTSPRKEMNPFLIKPEGMGASQIITLGRSQGVMSINAYRKYMEDRAPDIIRESLLSLEKDFDIIIAEGAGSPAEINLSRNDFANTFVSEINQTPCILVTDIDRGGAFASLYGTLKLMNSSHLVRWLVINRMSGDASMLDDGIEKIQRLTEKKCIGVVRKIRDIPVPGEDSLDYENPEVPDHRIAVVRYPFMENYSDVDPLNLRGVGFTYLTAENMEILDSCDLIVLPGSKNVPADLQYLRESGLAERIAASAQRGKRILGICGGYQMLGRTIRMGVAEKSDPIQGLSILRCETCYSDRKTVESCSGILNPEVFGESISVKGYEIHYGSVKDNLERPLAMIGDRREGSVSQNGRVIGTNLHSILENRKFLEYITGRAQLNEDYESILDRNIQKITEKFIESLDMSEILCYIREK